MQLSAKSCEIALCNMLVAQAGMAPPTAQTPTALDARPARSRTTRSQHVALCVDTILETVLRHVSVNDRLSSCALVCTDWHAAALAVTTKLHVEQCDRHVLDWLYNNGSRLRDLSIQSGSITAPEIGLASMAQLTQLTWLHLNNIRAPPALLRTIGESMQALQHLSMYDMSWGLVFGTSERHELFDCAYDLSEGCTQLTTLTIDKCNLDDICVMELCSNLRCLKKLDLSRNPLRRAICRLPTGLIHLVLNSSIKEFDPSELLQPNISPAGLSVTVTEGEEPNSNTSTSSIDVRVGLPNLINLDLSDITLTDPTCLSSLTALETLELHHVCVPDTSALLSSISHLTQMRVLCLVDCTRGSFTPEELKAALTPLTGLEYLDVYCDRYITAPGAAPADQQGLPDQCLFAGLSFPELNTLALKMTNISGMLYGLRLPDIPPLVHACPAVARLEVYIEANGPHPARLSALSELSQTLVDLSITAKHDQLDDGDMQCLAQLHGLKRLTVYGCGPGLTDRGLLTLTALTNLETLKVKDLEDSGVSQEVLLSQDKPSISLILESRYDKRGWLVASVSDQLRELCKNSPQLWRETQRELMEELKATRLELQQAKKDAAEQRRLLKAQQQLMGTVQGRFAELRRHLAEVQAELQPGLCIE